MNKQNLPAYITNIYQWLYLKPKVYKFLDNTFLLNCITLGYHHILTEELKKEIAPNSQILQIGVSLGSEIRKVYSVLKSTGSFTILDVCPSILNRCRQKNLDKRLSFINENAAKAIKGEYDTIICYMLLHEIPPLTRAKILSNTINALKPGGKAIFIDYHKPSSYHPLTYIIRTVNRLYQPFAEDLWKNSIQQLTPNFEKCSWSQQTYFGGVYQKVIATKNN